MNTAVEKLRPLLDQADIDWSKSILDAARAARAAVLLRAAEDAAAPREYACTLLLVVATSKGGAALQIGDGVIAYKDAEGWAPVFWPQKGEYANTTNFLTEENAEDVYAVAPLPPHRLDLAVMTDGLEPLALHFGTRTVHEPFLEAVFGPLRAETETGESKRVSVALERFLASPRIANRVDDDLTLCLAAYV